MSGENVAEIAMHRQMEMLIVCLDGGDEVINLDLSVKFFLYLAFQRLFRSLSIFDLSAGEFPFVLELAITALGGEDFPVSASDDCRNNFYGFHE